MVQQLIRREIIRPVGKGDPDLEQVVSRLNQYFFETSQDALCPCGHDHGYPLSTCDRFGVAVAFALCSKCGTIYRRQLWPMVKANEEAREIVGRLAFARANPQAIYRRELGVGHALLGCLGGQIDVSRSVVNVDALTGGSLFPFYLMGMETQGYGQFASLLAEGKKYGLSVELSEAGPHVLKAHDSPTLILAGELLLHSNDTPVTELSPASRASAEARSVSPSAVSVAMLGVTSTVPPRMPRTIVPESPTANTSESGLAHT